MHRAALYLLPSGLGATTVIEVLPPATLAVIRSLEYFVAESARTARAFLKAAAHPVALQSLHIETLDEHTPVSRMKALLQPLADGHACGLLSEAGCPAVADPGAELVLAAHESGFRVVPLVGPSAPVLALMASGMSGQSFAFHGYLPIEREARAKRLAELEKASHDRDTTQIFIEAPYRNDALFAAIVDTCGPDTLLCLATDLTLPSEAVLTKTVARWKEERPALDRRPTVFLLYRREARRGQKR